jgi:hypothetical protein
MTQTFNSISNENSSCKQCQTSWKALCQSSTLKTQSNLQENPLLKHPSSHEKRKNKMSFEFHQFFFVWQFKSMSKCVWQNETNQIKEVKLGWCFLHSPLKLFMA